MPRKGAADTNLFSLRIAEQLRARLDAEAERHGMSLNAEISYRLESSLYQQDVGQSVFGDEDIFTTVYMIAQLIRGFEQANGKKLREEFKTIVMQSVNAVFRFLDFAAESRGGLNKEYRIRDVVDLAVFDMTEDDRDPAFDRNVRWVGRLLGAGIGR